MRFATKFDPWLSIVLGLVGLALAARVGLLAVRTAGFPILPLMMGAGFIVALTLALPQYYEIRNEGLFIRQGWSKSLIPYKSIRSATSIDSLVSAPLFSSSRVAVESENQGSFLIAPVDRDRFVSLLQVRMQGSRVSAEN